MLNRRLQILIDDDRYRALAARAREEGVSIATLVRQAIDKFVPGTSSRKMRAWKRIMAADPMPVADDPAELKSEIRRVRSRGL